MEVIEIGSSSSESSGVEDVTPRADVHAAALREALAMAAALRVDATPARKKTTPKATATAKATPPRKTPTPTKSATPPPQQTQRHAPDETSASHVRRAHRAAQEKETETEDEFERPLSVRVARREVSGARPVQVAVPVCPRPPPPQVVVAEVVDLMSSSEGASTVEQSDDDDDDKIVLSVLARPSSAPRSVALGQDTSHTTKMASPAPKRRRLRRFDGSTRSTGEATSASTAVLARRSPPRQKTKKKRAAKSPRRDRLQDVFRSIEDKDGESGSDACTSSGMESLDSSSLASARFRSSSEEERSTLPPMRAGVLPPTVTARKSAPSARHTNFVLGGGSARPTATQANGRTSASVSARANASARDVMASPTESQYTSGVSSSSPSPLRPSKISLEDGGRALRMAMMTGIIPSSSGSFLPRDRLLKPPERPIRPLRDGHPAPIASGRTQEPLERVSTGEALQVAPTTEPVSNATKCTASPARQDGPATMDLCSSSDESMVPSVCSTIDLEREEFTQNPVAAVAPSLSTARSGSSPEASRSDGTVTPERASRSRLAKASARKRSHRVGSKPQLSTWRGPIPANLLGADSFRPFEKLATQPLSQFDPRGELEGACAYLATFGQTSGHLTSSSYSFDPMDAPQRVDKEAVEKEVRTILERELPRIRQCNAIRAELILSESRSRTSEYLEALDSHRSSLVHSALKRLVTCDRRRKISRIPSGQLPLVSAAQRNATRIFLCRDDIEERIGLLAKVRFLPTVEPLSRSVTCVTVSRNCRVDDDPILRLLPGAKDPAELEALRVAAEALALKNTSEFGLSPSALDDEVAEYAIRAVVAQCGDRDLVFDVLKKVAGLTQPYTDYSTMKKEHDASVNAQRRVADATRVVRDIDCEDGEPVALLESSSALKPMARKSLSERLAPPLTYFDSHIVRWQLERKAKPSGRMRALNVRRTGDYSAMMETYRDFFCRICYCYDCQEHGIEQPQPTRRVDPTYPRLKSQSKLRVEVVESEEDDSSADDSFEDTASEPSGSESGSNASSQSESEQRRRSARSFTVIATTATSSWARQERRLKQRRHLSGDRTVPALDETEYVDFSHAEILAPVMRELTDPMEGCSRSCWKASRTEAASVLRDDSTDVIVRKLAQMLGANACVISATMSATTCSEVHSLLQALANEDGGREDEVDRGRRGKKSSRGHSTSSHRDAFDRTRNQRQLDHANNHAYEPCNHSGPCVSTGCGCVRRDHNCEKACACPRDCPNRFKGCKCSHGSCRTLGCPCFAAGRECDPDLCFRCGAAEVALFPFLERHRRSEERRNEVVSVTEDSRRSPPDGVDSRPATCANVHLQGGLRQKIAIGSSRTHGLGAFATTPIRRGEFLSEYPGELISQDEAERRGLVYDRVSTSYLFDLNEDAVVDAIRMGNKTRFINHEPSHPNCSAKVVRVGPEHRITIWAKRDIRPGEELFFDYGFKPDCAPEWSRVAPSRDADQRGKDQ